MGQAVTIILRRYGLVEYQNLPVSYTCLFRLRWRTIYVLVKMRPNGPASLSQHVVHGTPVTTTWPLRLRSVNIFLLPSSHAWGVGSETRMALT